MTLYLSKVRTMFDYDRLCENIPSYNTATFAPPNEYHIGLVLGFSGCGKTQYLKSLNSHALLDLYTGWDSEQTVIENVDESPDESIARLLASGFSSVPQWFLKYSDLSEGQKFRAGIAKHLVSGNVAIDEFTSKLDRLTARNTAYNVHRYVHSRGLKGIIIASPFRDIVSYLRPDWIYDMSTLSYLIQPIYPLRKWTFAIVESVERVTDIDMGILYFLKSDMKTWDKYKQYHYLSSSILNNCEYWELYTKCENTTLAIGFIAIAPLPLKDFKAKREHRLVILPEVQGMGIGIAVSEYMGEQYIQRGYKYYCKTSHPKLGRYRNAHPEKWRPSTYNGKVSKGNKLSDRLFRKRNGLPYHQDAEVNEVVIDMKTMKTIHNRYNDSTEKVYYCHEFYTDNAISRTISETISVPVVRTMSAPPTVKNTNETDILIAQGWKPSSISGVMTITQTQAIVRFQQRKTYFKYDEYGGNVDKAKDAAMKYLERINIEHQNPNLYRVVMDGDREVAHVMIDRTLIICFDSNQLDTVCGKKLFYRKDTANKRIYYTTTVDNRKVRMYLNDVIEYSVLSPRDA